MVEAIASQTCLCWCLAFIRYTSIDGASSTAFRRKCSDDSVLKKALLMSAMLMTESWATEVRSCPWPQCFKVVPQDKQHSWHTLHIKELAVAFSFEM